MTPASGPRTACMVLHGRIPPDPRVERAIRVALEQGFDVDVIALRGPGEAAREALHGARVVRLPIGHGQGAGALAVAAEYVGFTALAAAYVAARTLRRRYDVVHVNNPPDFLMLAAMVPKLLGARVILDIHDFSWEMFLQRFGRRPGVHVAERPLRLVERVAARFADRVVTVHEPYRRALIDRGIPASKISVVMNTVDEGLLPAPSDRPPSAGFRVTYHGTVTPHYGVDLLVEAAAQAAAEIPDLRLEIYGRGDSVPAVRERIQALGMADRATLVGRFVPQADILRLVAGAHVGVIPNVPVPLNEHALPTKLFEYVMLGVPVVSADLPTLREHFSDEEIAFYRAGDTHALAAALVAVARDRDAAAARAEAARRRYEAYRWEISAERYASLLADGAPEPAGAAGTRAAAPRR